MPVGMRFAPGSDFRQAGARFAMQPTSD